jgi:segregation and condensation protein A
MPLALAQDAIALLIDLAERGEIDPWNVKVIDVIDRFLSELAPIESGRELYEENLSQSGQAFLYASMLLLLKAENLAQADAEESEELDPEDEELLEAEGVGFPLPPHLERRLRRRAVAPPPQKRRVTLKELIDQLQTIATALEDKTPRIRTPRPRNQSRSQAIRAIAQLAHQENLSEMAAALEQFFAEHRVRFDQQQDWLDFELLLEMWMELQTHEEPHPNPNHDRVGIFWALLLLCAQSKVELSQDKFYGALKVRVIRDQPAVNATEPFTRANPE